MSGFNTRYQEELGEWMAQTIQFAMISSGRDEVTGEEVLRAVHQALAVVPDDVESRGLVLGTLATAEAILWPPGSDREAVEERVRWEAADQEDIATVKQWVLETIIWVSGAQGSLFGRREEDVVVEVEDEVERAAFTANEIIAGVLGNKRRARRVDLEEIVRKVVRRSLEYLTPAPEHGPAVAP